MDIPNDLKKAPLPKGKLHSQILFSEISPNNKWLEIAFLPDISNDSQRIYISDLKGNQIEISQWTYENEDKVTKSAPSRNRTLLIVWKKNPMDTTLQEISSSDPNQKIEILEKDFSWHNDQTFAIIKEDKNNSLMILDAIFISNGDDILSLHSRYALKDLIKNNQWQSTHYPGSEMDSVCPWTIPHINRIEKFTSSKKSWSLSRKIQNGILKDSNSKEDWQVSLSTPGQVQGAIYVNSSNANNLVQCHNNDKDQVLTKNQICDLGKNSIIEINGLNAFGERSCQIEFIHIESQLTYKGSCWTKNKNWYAKLTTKQIGGYLIKLKLGEYFYQGKLFITG